MCHSRLTFPFLTFDHSPGPGEKPKENVSEGENGVQQADG